MCFRPPKIKTIFASGQFTTAVAVVAFYILRLLCLVGDIVHYFASYVAVFMTRTLHLSPHQVAMCAIPSYVCQCVWGGDDSNPVIKVISPTFPNNALLIVRGRLILKGCLTVI